MKRYLACYIVLLLITASTPAWASKKLIVPSDQDVTVSETHPDGPINKRLHAGVGRGGSPVRLGRSRSYLRFNLGAIPRPDLLRGVSIDTATLHIFVLAHALTPKNRNFNGKRYLVSVSSCASSNWSEATMTWKTQVCADGEISQDTKIVDGDMLPAPHTWDVTQEFEQAVSAGFDHATLIIDSQRLLNCSRDPLEGQGCPDVERVGFLRFASRERVDFGISVVPRVVISYSEYPTSFRSYVSSTLAVLSAIAMLLGLYGAIRGFRKRRD